MEPSPSIATHPSSRAGLSARLCAGILDLGLVVLAVTTVASALAHTGRYLPIEITVATVYALYTAALLSLRARTLGGEVCGMSITDLQNRKLKPVRALLRSIVVAAAQILLCLPFLVLLVKRNKRGWHDVLAGSQVIIDSSSYRQKRVRTLVLVVLGLVVSIWIGQTLIQIHSHRQWNCDASQAGFTLLGDSNQASAVQSLTHQQRQNIIQWLGERASDPCEYLIDTATRHQVTLVGEVHGIKQNLEFFNQNIPDLYHKSGVRVIALECLSSVQDKEVKRLVNASTFDQTLFKKIAREHCWPTWGHKNHWRVLETVWQLNQGLPPKNRLQVIGIAPELDMVSFHMVKFGPWWEKLRLARFLPMFPALATHDAHYARCVERAAFGAYPARTLVWVGGAHTPLTFSRRIIRKGKSVHHSYRMGALLVGRYPHQIAQVILHNEIYYPKITNLIETGLAHSGKAQIGFATIQSPLSLLFDRTTPPWLFRNGYRPCFGDLNQGYILLEPVNKLEQDTWWQGYIDRRMFGRFHPFYEMVTQRTLTDHRDAEKHMHLASGQF